VELSGYFPKGIGRGTAQALFYQDQVPFLTMDVRGLLGRARLLVARDFFFDALDCLRRATAQLEVFGGEEWRCPACEEQVPGNFGVCWNCGADRPT
jgi:hypothetical protein